MTARRIIAISDLHIGGEEHPMLGHPEYLTDFLGQLTAYRPPEGEELELVIHGDFIDFLAEPPYAAWTQDEAAALTKFAGVSRRFNELFDGFASYSQAGHRLTILLGNHDVELALPKVREALFRRLGTDPHCCHFVMNNEAYRIGDLLIEHGNRYDSWNAVNYDQLRQIVSSLSRGETAPRLLEVCPGSRLVEEVMNPLKERYHFIDLLKPETKVVVLLLTAIEPALKYDLKKIFSAAMAYTQQWRTNRPWQPQAPSGPKRAQLVTGGPALEEMPEDLRQAFHEELIPLDASLYPVTTHEPLRKLFATLRPDSLRARLERGESVEEKQLNRIQVALRHALESDRTFELDEPDGPYHAAAERMIVAGMAKVVVMGHTHLARDCVKNGMGYLNTGTWADLIQIPQECLQGSPECLRQLECWLKSLVLDELDSLRTTRPTYADVTLDCDGHLVTDGRRRLLRSLTDGKVAE